MVCRLQTSLLAVVVLRDMLVYLSNWYAYVIRMMFVSTTRFPVVQLIYPMSIHCIGIDLGMTNSTVSYVSDASAVIHTVERDGCSFPSTVRFIETGKMEPCVRISECSSYGFAVNSKRLIGRSIHNSFVVDNRMAFGCNIDEVNSCTNKRRESSTHEPGYCNPYSKKIVSATEIIACILQYLKKKAEIEIGHSVENVVLTVPMMCTWEQRIATIEAAELTGFNVVTLQPDPVMAVFDYCTTNNIDNGVFAVYDFGGGTFDATIVSVKNKKYTTIQNGGDDTLGGETITQVMIKQIEMQYENKYGESIYAEVDEAETRLKLRTYIEKAKKDLRDMSESIPIDLQGIIPNRDFSISVTFDIPEVDAIVHRTVKLMKRLIFECKMKVDRILMIGGSSQFIPCEPLLKATFPETMVENYYPFHSVSRGAALCASLYPDGFNPKNDDGMFVNRMEYLLGIEYSNEKVTIVVDKSMLLPHKLEKKVKMTDKANVLYMTIIEGFDSNRYRRCNIAAVEMSRDVTTEEVLTITFFVMTDLMLYVCIVDQQGKCLAPYQRVKLHHCYVCCIIESLRKTVRFAFPRFLNLHNKQK